jgi:DNA polymerase III subunit epsilon
LSNAVRYYLGREHGQAHSARHDADATAEVMVEQIKRYGLPENIVELSSNLVEVDLARRFRRDEHWHIVFGFGKHARQRLSEVARTNPDYLRWMLDQSFLDDGSQLVRQPLAGRLYKHLIICDVLSWFAAVGQST